mmetsp:Transcript_24186/g.65512  ORF Transcript_24186/g.65512 Transcript_24186/m.65512 type:complete len:384 (+) Transcript_24186:1893-3044(+)
MVVLRYFSCPARSMKLTTLDERCTTSCQLEPARGTPLPPSVPAAAAAEAGCAAPSAPAGSTGLVTAWAFITLPCSSNPRCWSSDMDEVRPDSASCLCLRTLSLADPRPLSSAPPTSTPTSVDLPASTLPMTAHRRLRWRSSEGGRRTSTSRRMRESPRVAEARWWMSWQLAPRLEVATSDKRARNPSACPGSTGPSSKSASPCPSKRRACRAARSRSSGESSPGSTPPAPAATSVTVSGAAPWTMSAVLASLSGCPSLAAPTAAADAGEMPCAIVGTWSRARISAVTSRAARARSSRVIVSSECASSPPSPPIPPPLLEPSSSKRLFGRDAAAAVSSASRESPSSPPWGSSSSGRAAAAAAKTAARCAPCVAAEKAAAASPDA